MMNGKIGDALQVAEPTEKQAATPKTFGDKVDNGVLQKQRG
jgi:hypothetical protein